MKNSILTLFLTIITCFCFGQITVQVKQNPNPNISTWENRENVISVTVNNRGPAVEARFSSMIKLDGSVKASTNFEQMPMVTIERGMNRFAIDEVMPYRAVTISDINTKNMARTGQLPAGNYELCVSLLDNNKQPVIGIQEACTYFLLTQVQLPILIAPFENQVIQGNIRPTFSWTPATPVSPGTQVTYKLQVFEILEGQGMMQALQGNRPIISEEVERLTQYWPTEWDIPNNNSTFVWTVQALDQNGAPLGENNGIASPITFKIDNSGGGNKIADGDPWVQCLAHTCRIKGVKLELYVPSDAVTTGSTTYKISAWSINISYYATASQVIAEFGSTGASEVSDWIGYVSAGSGMSYCDKNGHPIYDQVVYEVTKANPNNYNGNTNELHASGACFNYDTFTALANHYNAYNGTFTDVPTSCVEGCVSGGGIDNGDPGSGSNGTNAAGEEIDDITLDPIDEDGGGISPGGNGGLIGYEEAPLDIATNPDIIWVDINGVDFKPYKGIVSKKDFCFCADGTYCEGKPNCDCCPKKPNEMQKSSQANICKCEVDNKTVTVVSNNECSSVCNRIKTKVKDCCSGRSSGVRQHKIIKP